MSFSSPHGAGVRDLSGPLRALGFAPTLQPSQDQAEVATSKGMRGGGRGGIPEAVTSGAWRPGACPDPDSARDRMEAKPPGWDSDGGESPVPHRSSPPPSPGSAWPARSHPWYRRPRGSWCSSSAKMMTPPWSPMAGGRKTGSPSPPTGVCVAAPDVPWGGKGASRAPAPSGRSAGGLWRAGLVVVRSQSSDPHPRTQAQAAAGWLPGHQPPAGRGRWHLQLWWQQAGW